MSLPERVRAGSEVAPWVIEQIDRLEAELEMERRLSFRNQVAHLEAERDAAVKLNKEWEQKAATWMASPEAAQRLEGYREMGRKLAAKEAERDAAVAALEMIAGVRPCPDNLMSDKDIARAAIDAARGESPVDELTRQGQEWGDYKP